MESCPVKAWSVFNCIAYCCQRLRWPSNRTSNKPNITGHCERCGTLDLPIPCFKVYNSEAKISITSTKPKPIRTDCINAPRARSWRCHSSVIWIYRVIDATSAPAICRAMRAAPVGEAASSAKVKCQSLRCDSLVSCADISRSAALVLPKRCANACWAKVRACCSLSFAPACDSGRRWMMSRICARFGVTPPKPPKPPKPSTPSST